MSMDLVKAVREHAGQHLDEGWSFVDRLADEQLITVIGKSRTEKGAIAKAAGFVEQCIAEQEAAAQATTDAAESDVEPAEAEDGDIEGTGDAAESDDAIEAEEAEDGDIPGTEGDPESDAEPTGDADPTDDTPDAEGFAQPRTDDDVDLTTGEVKEATSEQTDTGEHDEATEPPAGAYANVDVETVLMPYYKGVVKVTVPQDDGTEKVETVECPHSRYWHEKQENALACARKVARERGLAIR